MSTLIARSLRGSAVMVAATLAFGTLQSPAAENQSLFTITRDPATIRTQMHLALPELERGLRLLQASPDPAQASKGVAALYDSYRYLRAAQESSTQLNNNQKFPDPMVDLRNQRIWKVRTRLIKCQSTFVPTIDDTIAMCAEEAAAAVRELRLILQVFP